MKRAVLGTFALSLLAAPASAQSDGAKFPELAFLQLPRGKAKRPKPFPWPRAETFRKAWKSGPDAKLVQVVEVKWTHEGKTQDVLLGVEPADKGQEVFVIQGPNREVTYAIDRALRSDTLWTPKHPWAPGRQVIHNGEREVVLEVVRASSADAEPDAQLWAAWTYLKVLLDESPPKADEFPIPAGFCSMDTAPQRAAREHAETCFEAGRMGCFLDFQIRIMGDQFDRAVWSSYGERAHGTESERLLDTGLDLHRFFRGLLVRFATSETHRRQLGLWRLARALVELGDDTHVAAVTRLANDPMADEYNRLRAAQTLVYLQIARARAKDLDMSVGRALEKAKPKLTNPSWSSTAWYAAVAGSS